MASGGVVPVETQEPIDLSRGDPASVEEDAVDAVVAAASSNPRRRRRKIDDFDESLNDN
jgi:hypothetical protein